MKKKGKKAGRTGVLCLLAGILASGLWSAPAYGEWTGSCEEGWRYLEDGKEKAGGWLWDETCWYHLGADGLMDTGWFQENGQWYYLFPEPGSPQGSAASGWQKIGEKWYYFHPLHDGTFGHMKADCRVDGWILGPDGAWTGERNCRDGCGNEEGGGGGSSGRSGSSGGSGGSSGGGSSSSGSGGSSGGGGSSSAEEGSSAGAESETEDGDVPAGTESETGSVESPSGTNQQPETGDDPAGTEAGKRLAAWENRAAAADLDMLGEDGRPGHDWLVTDRAANDRRIAGILSRLDAGSSGEIYLIGVNYEPESLIFAYWPDVLYSLREEDRFEYGGNSYTVMVADVEKHGEKEETGIDERTVWKEGDIQEQVLGHQTLRFRCIDSEFSVKDQPAALFLCEEVIPSDTDSDEIALRKLSFGENSSYKTSRIRDWLQKNTGEKEEILKTSVGVTRAYTGMTEPGAYGDLNTAGIRPYEIGFQKMEDRFFILSVEEAVRYKEELWKFGGEERPESQIGPCSRGYWLRTPVYEEENGVFVCGGEAYVVDLEEGCIRPEPVSSEEMGIRPAYAVRQGEKKGEE